MVAEYVLDCDRLSQKGRRSARTHARPDGNSVQSGRVGSGDARTRKGMYQAGVVDRDDGAEHACSKSLGMTTDMLSRFLDRASSGNHSENVLLKPLRHVALVLAPVRVSVPAC